MIKRASIALVSLALAVTGPSVALGASHHHKRHKHKIADTVQQTILSSTGNPPAPNSSAVVVGSVHGKPGPGAVVGRTVFGSTPGSFTGTGTTFFKNGSVKASLKGTGTLNPDGSESFSGTGKVLGGTGAYKHSKGTFKFSGSQPKGSNVQTYSVRGHYTTP